MFRRVEVIRELLRVYSPQIMRSHIVTSPKREKTTRTRDVIVPGTDIQGLRAWMTERSAA